MRKYMVMTSEFPGDALVVVGWYDDLNDAKAAADEHLANGRDETVCFVVELPYFVAGAAHN